MAKEIFRYLRGELNGFYIRNIQTAWNTKTEDIKDFFNYFSKAQFYNNTLSDSDLRGLGIFAGIFLPRIAQEEATTSLKMTESFEENGYEFSERGLYNTENEIFEFKHLFADSLAYEISSHQVTGYKSGDVCEAGDKIFYILKGNYIYEGQVSEEFFTEFKDFQYERPSLSSLYTPEFSSSKVLYANNKYYLTCFAQTNTNTYYLIVYESNDGRNWNILAFIQDSSTATTANFVIAQNKMFISEYNSFGFKVIDLDKGLQTSFSASFDSVSSSSGFKICSVLEQDTEKVKILCSPFSYSNDTENAYCVINYDLVNNVVEVSNPISKEDDNEDVVKDTFNYTFEVNGVTFIAYSYPSSLGDTTYRIYFLDPITQEVKVQTISNYVEYDGISKDSIVYFDNKYVFSSVCYSADLITFTECNVTDFNYRGKVVVAYNNTLYTSFYNFNYRTRVEEMGILSSNDGINWVKSIDTTDIGRVHNLFILGNSLIIQINKGLYIFYIESLILGANLPYLDAIQNFKDILYQQRGGTILDSITEKIIQNTENITSPDINTLATPKLRSSLVGNEDIQGYISSDSNNVTEVIDSQGLVRPEKILNEPPSDKAYSEFYGNQFLFLSENQLTYSDISYALYSSLFKILQKIKFSGATLNTLSQTIQVLCPELVKITSINLTQDKSHFIINYIYDEDVNLPYKNQRVSLLNYILRIKFPLFILQETMGL